MRKLSLFVLWLMELKKKKKKKTSSFPDLQENLSF